MLHHICVRATSLLFPLYSLLLRTYVTLIYFSVMIQYHKSINSSVLSSTGIIQGADQTRIRSNTYVDNSNSSLSDPGTTQSGAGSGSGSGTSDFDSQSPTPVPSLAKGQTYAPTNGTESKLSLEPPPPKDIILGPGMFVCTSVTPNLIEFFVASSKE